MRVTDGDLRRALTARAEPSRTGCPSAETLASAASGGLEGPERDTVVDHLGRCRDCAEEVQQFRSLELWSRVWARRLTPVRGSLKRWPAWAAAALLLLGLPLLVTLPESGPPATREQPEAAILSLLPESTPVPRDRVVLRWSEVGEGARYSVSVLTLDLRPLARADGLERPEYAVAPAALEPVPPGGQIVWSVEARWSDGRRLSSPTFVTRLD
jgi:hypothetical protein